MTGEMKPTFSITYEEGLKVGYKWYDAEKKPVLFPFGFGLSYTTFAYSNMKVTPGADGTTVTFSVKNTGKRDGVEIAEVYAALPAAANEPPKRLVGWSRVVLRGGESKDVTVNVSREYLSIYDDAASAWKLVPGEYSFMAGALRRLCRSRKRPTFSKFRVKNAGGDGLARAPSPALTCRRCRHKMAPRRTRLRHETGSTSQRSSAPRKPPPIRNSGYVAGAGV